MQFIFLTKEYIYSRIPQDAIFAKYGVPYQEGMFRSTLRDDKNPTCSFYTKRGILIMRDFSGHFWGDAINLVKFIYSVGYYKALQIVANDFGLYDGVEKEPPIHSIIPEKQKTTIRVKRREWDKDTLKFWKEFRISPETLSYFNTYSAERVWLNDEPVYKYNPSNPAYIYHFQEYDYQIYIPHAIKPAPRFLISNGGLIHGFQQLPPSGELCVITKSRKDVMCLYEFGITAIAPMAESIILSEEVIDILKLRFNNIVSLMDYDNTGIHNAWTLRKLYGIQPLFFTSSVWNRKGGFKGAKDFSDYAKLYNRSKTLKLIENVKHSSSKGDHSVYPA
jgi:hypothetical protein